MRKDGLSDFLFQRVKFRRVKEFCKCHIQSITENLNRCNLQIPSP